MNTTNNCMSIKIALKIEELFFFKFNVSIKFKIVEAALTNLPNQMKPTKQLNKYI